MCSYNKKNCPGVTLIELVIAMLMSSMLVLTVGVLLVSGQRAWQNVYNSAYHEIKQDAQAIRISFGSMGRRSNRLNYTLYEVDGGDFTPVEPEGSSDEEVLYGDAVEFRYWDVELDSEDSHGLLDVSKIATAYALFYLDDTQLKVDYGPYPPGGIPAGGGSRSNNNVTTVVLSEYVDDDDNDDGIFSHTMVSGTGKGCIRINVTLNDTETDESIKVMTAALMRNIWPR
ncbi:hypothetical protein ACFL1G_01865 [Planctomycetota bacterium]